MVVLRLGAKGVQSGDDAIRLLSKMFSKDLKYDEKIASLRDDFHISVTREVSEEVPGVCNLSTGIFNKGYDSGYDTGISDKCRDMVLSLYDLGDPIEKIAKVSKIGVETVHQWLDERQEGKA